jgi:malate permease and related proteins
LVVNAIGAVLSIFFMVAVGMLVYFKKWITRENASVFAKIVINVAVPANVIYSFVNRFDKSALSQSGLFILIGFIMMLITYYISHLFIWIFKIRKERRGIFSVLFAFSNSVFIGFPIAKALFGEDAMLYAVIFYLVNTILFWTIGNLGIRKDCETQNSEKISFLDIIKKVFNIPILSIGLAFLLIYFEVSFPKNVMSTLGYLSNLTTPLSMIFTGIVLADMGIAQLKFERDVLLVMVGRVLVAPMVMLLVTTFFGIEGLGQQVFIMQSTLPIMLQSVIVAEYYGADSNFATKSFAWTTVFSIISIPIYMILMTLFL